MRPTMNKACRLLVILLVALIPLALMAALMPEAFRFAVGSATPARFLARLPRLLEPIGFCTWTVLVGLLIYSSVCWYKNPVRRNFLHLLLIFPVLGSGFLMFLRMAFFFSMPGDGPIP